eukprot:351435-Rhodomonas_salina.5
MSLCVQGIGGIGAYGERSHGHVPPAIPKPDSGIQLSEDRGILQPRKGGIQQPDGNLERAPVYARRRSLIQPLPRQYSLASIVPGLPQLLHFLVPRYILGQFSGLALADSTLHTLCQYRTAARARSVPDFA